MPEQFISNRVRKLIEAGLVTPDGEELTPRGESFAEDRERGDFRDEPIDDTPYGRDADF